MSFLSEENNLDLALVVCPAWGVFQPPIGISYLKGYLKDRGISVRCFDFNFDLYRSFHERKYWDMSCVDYFVRPKSFQAHIAPFLTGPIEKWANEILSHNPAIVGFSLFKSTINVSFILARELRKRKPSLIIIGGGPEVNRIKRYLVDGIGGFTDINKEFFSDNNFNVLVDGEGEEALFEIVLSLKEDRDIRCVDGCLYLDNGKIIANRSREWIKKLDLLPPPDFHDFELSSYTRSSLPLVTSRGCIKRCTFCAESPLWEIYRFRSAGKVVEDMKILSGEYDINKFEITDSTFNGDIRRVERICGLIIESKLDVKWTTKVTLRKEMDYALLRKMKEAGCVSLAYGIESGSPVVLRDMRKNSDINQVSMIVRDTHKAGINADCFFMVGYPTETDRDFVMTLDFIRDNARFINCFPSISACNIEENSYLGLNYNKYGIYFKEDGWHSEFSTPQIRKERLARIRELAKEIKRYQ